MNGTVGFKIPVCVAELCNGSTYDSDSYCLGSNPSSAAKKKASLYEMLFFLPIVGRIRRAEPSAPGGRISEAEAQ